jgi:hypothetical protein
VVVAEGSLGITEASRQDLQALPVVARETLTVCPGRQPRGLAVAHSLVISTVVAAVVAGAALGAQAALLLA